MSKQLRQVYSRIRSYFPSALPKGMTEFENWSNDIIELSGRVADEVSIKFALASMLMHLSPSKNIYQTQFGSVPKNHFVQGLLASAAKQVAQQKFQDIKQAQIDAQKKAEEDAKVKSLLADVTASEVVDVNPIL